jgi:hypothetical protein
MGCGSKTPSYTPPPAPAPINYQQDILNPTISAYQTNTPQAFGAREGALSTLSNPQSTMDYYNAFQPTSFEQALGNQYFQNIYPDVQKQIAGRLSSAGIASSPILARLSGKAYGDLGVQIGQYLSNQANDRATGSLNARLGVNPWSDISPMANQGLQNAQWNQQQQAQYAQQQAMAQYQQQMNSYNQSAGIKSLLGTGLGAGLGALFALPTGGLSLAAGAGLGSSIGGAGAQLFGGGQAPISLGQGLGIANMFQPGGLSSLGSPQNVFSYGNPYSFAQAPYTK